MAARKEPDLEPVVVRYKTAAQLLGVGMNSIDRMLKRGELERVRLSERMCGISMRSIHAIGEGALNDKYDPK